MKVRIGVGVGGASSSPDDLGATCTAMEQLGFDSVWLADVLSVPVDDPMVGLAYVAGRLTRLKLGTTLVGPGRNIVRLARQVVTLDRLSGGRLLLTVVPGLRRRRELAALGVTAAEREPALDELLPVLRRLLAGETVDHESPTLSLSGVRVDPMPMQHPFDIWTGGVAPAALERAAALADGWLPSLCPPEEAGRGRRHIEGRAQELGRRIDPEHFGVSIAYLADGAPEELRARAAARRPGVEPAAVVPVGRAELRALLERYVDAGISKFVVRPVPEPDDWRQELEALSAAVLDLQR